MRSTIKDVALQAGVSIATVSNVISGKKYVSDELTSKVKKTMGELDYQPNLVASGLKIKKTYKIGIVVPDILNPFYGTLVRSIERAFDGTPYQLLLSISDYDASKEMRFINSFVNSGHVDGLMLATPGIDFKELKRGLEIPVVAIDRFPSENENDIFFVYTDNVMASSQLAEFAYQKGYRRFAYIAGSENINTASLRVRGFLECLRKLGVPNSNIVVTSGEVSFDFGYQNMLQLLNQYDMSYRLAVLSSSDMAAWGALEAVKSCGFRIPNDIGIVGFDNAYFSEFLTPRLTTFHNPSSEMGSVAAAHMLEVLSTGIWDGERFQIIEGRLVERESL